MENHCVAILFYKKKTNTTLLQTEIARFFYLTLPGLHLFYLLLRSVLCIANYTIFLFYRNS